MGSVCSKRNLKGKLPNKRYPAITTCDRHFPRILQGNKGSDPENLRLPWSPFMQLFSLIYFRGTHGVAGFDPKCTYLHLKSHSSITDKRQPGIILRTSLSCGISQKIVFQLGKKLHKITSYMSKVPVSTIYKVAEMSTHSIPFKNRIRVSVILCKQTNSHKYEYT